MTGYQSKKAAASAKTIDEVNWADHEPDGLAQPEQDKLDSMEREALKLALEALEAAEIDGNCEYGATEIIRKALAQPEQRTWVGLTEQEKWEILLATERDDRDDVMEMTEAKLKEKNT